MRMRRRIYKLTTPRIKKFLYKRCKKKIVKTLKKKKFKKKMINLGFLKLNKNMLSFFINIFFKFLKINNFFFKNIFFLSVPNLSLLKNTIAMTKYSNTNYMASKLLKKNINGFEDVLLGTNIITFSNLTNSNDYSTSKSVKRYLYKYNYLLNLTNLSYKNTFVLFDSIVLYLMYVIYFMYLL